MTGVDVLVTGLARSGTTLTCHLLNKLPDVVALHEPMDVKALAALPDRRSVLDAIQAFARAQRATLAADRTAISKQEGGSVPDNPMSDEPDAAGLRGTAVHLAPTRFEQALTPDVALVIKHPMAFTALLADLVGNYPVFAVVRNPLAVLGSWSSVRLAVRNGHAPAAERFAPDLAARLDSIPDRLERQVALLSWCFEQYHAHLPDDHVLRYEDVVASGGAALAAIVPAARALHEPLESKNRSPFYDRATLDAVGERLLRVADGPWHYYARADVEAMLR